MRFTCEVCEGPFDFEPRGQFHPTVCSDKCQEDAAAKEKAESKTKVCRFCKQDFQQERKGNKEFNQRLYCSMDCYAAYKRGDKPPRAPYRKKATNTWNPAKALLWFPSAIYEAPPQPCFFICNFTWTRGRYVVLAPNAQQQIQHPYDGWHSDMIPHGFIPLTKDEMKQAGQMWKRRVQHTKKGTRKGVPFIHVPLPYTSSLVSAIKAVTLLHDVDSYLEVMPTLKPDEGAPPFDMKEDPCLLVSRMSGKSTELCVLPQEVNREQNLAITFTEFFHAADDVAREHASSV